MIRDVSAVNWAKDLTKCMPLPAFSGAPFGNCSHVVRIGVFFDGTGQNKNHPDEMRRSSHSNIARLWAAHRADGKSGVFKIYNSGPGTPVEVSHPQWWESVPGSEKAGLASGFGGDIRLARAEAELRSKLNSVSRIQQVEVSVFGFSRGAALARGFVNRLRGYCHEDSAGLLFEGRHPIIFKFLGIFDTVASFGLPATNLDSTDVQLEVPECVEKVRHFVAAHELRFSFPLDTIRVKGRYPQGDRVERVYPGVHSDVGGGYAPIEQGRNDNLAKIICNDMLIECWQAGLPFFSKQQIEADFEYLKPMFDYPETAYDTYRYYLKAVGAHGTVESQLLQHCLAYYQYRGHSAVLPDEKEASFQAMASRRAVAQKQYCQELAQKQRGQLRAAKEDLVSADGQLSGYQDGDKEIAWEARQLMHREEVARASPLTRAMMSMGTSSMSGVTPTQNGAEQVPMSQDELAMLDAWRRGKKGVNTDVARFLDQMVHDSKASFLPEPTGYFRRRGVYQCMYVPPEQRRSAGPLKTDREEAAAVARAQQQELERAQSASRADSLARENQRHQEEIARLTQRNQEVLRNQQMSEQDKRDFTEGTRAQMDREMASHDRALKALKIDSVP